MFEFDEHYDELEALQSDEEIFQQQCKPLNPNWVFVGHDVWRINLAADVLKTPLEWQLEAAEVA